MDAEDPLAALQEQVAQILRGLPALGAYPIICEAAEDFEASLERKMAANEPLFIIVSTPDQEAPGEEHPSTHTAPTIINIELAYTIGPAVRTLRPSRATALIGRALHGLPGPVTPIFYKGYATLSQDGRLSRSLNFRTQAPAW